MTINEQQQRAVVYLAASCRPSGARRWNEAGIAAAVAKVAHRSLPDVILAVVRAAADRNAETPGVIPSAGPHWEEGSYQPVHEPVIVPSHLRCRVCDHPEAECRRLWTDDHDYDPRRNLKRAPDAIHAIVEEAKGRLEPMSEPPPPDDRTTGRLRELLPSPAHAAPTEETT